MCVYVCLRVCVFKSRGVHDPLLHSLMHNNHTTFRVVVFLSPGSHKTSFFGSRSFVRYFLFISFNIFSLAHVFALSFFSELHNTRARQNATAAAAVRDSVLLFIQIINTERVAACADVDGLDVN